MSSEDWDQLHCILREQFKSYGSCGKNLLKYIQPKYDQLYDLIKHSALTNENDSILIIGPPGSGKSALVDNVLNQVMADQQINSSMICIKLNGLIHTDDNLALDSIMQQLEFVKLEQKALGSYSEKLSILLSAFKNTSENSKALLFIIDNFDLFCHHKDQTLLYNLFDVIQSPVCIIGMTCRIDIMQILENRVQSRLSNKKIVLSEEVTFDEYVEAAKVMLKISSNFNNSNFKNCWNSEVSEIFQEQSVKDVLKSCYKYSHSFVPLKKMLFLATMKLGPNHTKLEASDFKEAFKLSHQDGKAFILRGLSTLEISIIIAIMHLTEICDGEPFNFEILHNELVKYFKKKMAWHLEKSVIMKAFEHLLDLELIKPCGELASNTQKRYRLIRFLLEEEQVKAAIEQYPNLPVPLKQWAVSSIDG